MKRPTRTRPPVTRVSRPDRQKVTLSVPSELMERLTRLENARGYRQVNLSALLSRALRTWLDEHPLPDGKVEGGD